MNQQVNYDIIAELELPDKTIILTFDQTDPKKNKELLYKILSKKEIYREIVYTEKIIYEQKLQLFRLVKKQIFCQNYNTYDDVKILILDVPELKSEAEPKIKPKREPQPEPERELEYLLLKLKELSNINYKTDRDQFTFEVTLQFKIMNQENSAEKDTLDITKIEIKNKEQSQNQNGYQAQRNTHNNTMNQNQVISSRNSQLSQENFIENSSYRMNVDQNQKFVYFDSEEKHQYKKEIFSGNDILDVNINLRKLYNISEQIEIDVQKIDSRITIANVYVYVGFQFSFKAEYNALPIGIFDYKKLDSPYNGKKIDLTIPNNMEIPLVYESENINVKHFVIINVEFQKSYFLSQYPNIDIIFPIILFKDNQKPQLLKNIDKYFEIQKSVAIVEFTPQNVRPEYSQLLNLQQNLQIRQSN